MPVKKSIRRIGLAAAFCLAGSATAADNVAYPTRPIMMVVPQAPGGAADSLARPIMQKLSIALGQPVVIENRVGAGGLIGTRYVAKAANDGYTLLFTSTSHSINAALNKRAGYDAIKDFTPVALLGRSPFVLVANPGFEAKKTADLIAMAKKNPGGIDYGSVGIGSFNHLLGEMFNAEAHIKLRHVPYKGSSEAASAVVGGQIPLSFNSLPGVLPLIRAGKLRALGVTTPDASALAPDIPPLSVAVPGYEGISWLGIVAPAGMPKPAVDKLTSAIQRVLLEPDVSKVMMQLGIQATYGNSKEFGDFLTAQNTLWRNVIKDADIKLGD